MIQIDRDPLQGVAVTSDPDPGVSGGQFTAAGRFSHCFYLSSTIYKAVILLHLII